MSTTRAGHTPGPWLDCEVCGGDCSAANPPVTYCPVKERKQRKEAVERAREMLNLGINIQATGDATNAIVTGVLQSLLDQIEELDADLKCAIAVGRHIARQALTVAAPGEQQPVAWQFWTGECWVLCEPPDARELRDEPEKFRPLAPPAAGWDEATRYLQKIADLVDDENACEPLDDAISYANKALEALRREAQGVGDEPIADTGNTEADDLIGRLMSSDPDFNDCTDAAVFIRKLVVEHKGPDGFATWKDAAIAERMKRPDAGGGVREACKPFINACDNYADCPDGRYLDEDATITVGDLRDLRAAVSKSDDSTEGRATDGSPSKRIAPVARPDRGAGVETCSSETLSKPADAVNASAEARLRRTVLDVLNSAAPAVENLACNQEQADMDGCMVKVSRQALDEVLAAVNEVAIEAALSNPPAAVESNASAELEDARAEAADSLRTLDAIAEYVGCPNDEELTVEHVRQHYMKLENAAQRQGIEDAGRVANAQAYASAEARLREALERIKQIIEDVDNRCLAADGPVTPTNQEISLDELRRIYALSCGYSEDWRP